MKNYGIDLIKDFIISILIVVCIAIILSIILYDKISLTKVIPESDEYFLTEEMEQEIKEKETEKTQTTIVNYYIDAADLRKYKKANEYSKGKRDPFSEYSEGIDDNTLTNFYEDDGTK